MYWAYSDTVILCAVQYTVIHLIWHCKEENGYSIHYTLQYILYTIHCHYKLFTIQYSVYTYTGTPQDLTTEQAHEGRGGKQNR